MGKIRDIAHQGGVRHDNLEGLSFCHQPLVNRAAVEHLRREQEKFERRLRQKAEREAAASLRPKVIAEVRREVEVKYRRREKEREGTVRELRGTIGKLRQEKQAMRRRADRAEREAASRLRPEIRAELEETFSRQNRAKDKTIERLRRDLDEANRRLEQWNRVTGARSGRRISNNRSSKHSAPQTTSRGSCNAASPLHSLRVGESYTPEQSPDGITKACVKSRGHHQPVTPCPWLLGPGILPSDCGEGSRKETAL